MVWSETSCARASASRLFWKLTKFLWEQVQQHERLINLWTPALISPAPDSVSGGGGCCCSSLNWVGLLAPGGKMCAIPQTRQSCLFIAPSCSVTHQTLGNLFTSAESWGTRMILCLFSSINNKVAAHSQHWCFRGELLKLGFFNFRVLQLTWGSVSSS